MGETITDAEAIRASLRDPERFGTVFDRHFGSIHRYVARRLGLDLAEELAAEVFVTAFEIRARYDGTHRSARPWLFGIAANLIRRQRRTELRQLRAYARQAADPAQGWVDMEPDARLDAEASRRQLAETLASLGADEREVLLLYAWGELSYPEIAEALDIPPGTVKSRLYRARRQVRELLGVSGQFAGEELEGAHNG